MRNCTRGPPMAPRLHIQSERAIYVPGWQGAGLVPAHLRYPTDRRHHRRRGPPCQSARPCDPSRVVASRTYRADWHRDPAPNNTRSSRYAICTERACRRQTRDFASRDRCGFYRASIWRTRASVHCKPPSSKEQSPSSQYFGQGLSLTH